MPHTNSRRRTHRLHRLTVAFVALSTALTGLLAVAATAPAQAAPSDAALPSDNPHNWTPKVLDGKVDAIKQVGNVVVVGGTFNQIQNTGTNQPILAQPSLFAYDATTGRIIESFRPTVDDDVDAVIAGSSPNTVYVAGAFSNVNGVGGRVAELDVNDAERTDFRAQGINSRVYDIKLVGQKLFVAGSFTSVNGSPEGYLAALDATTGDRLAGYDVPDFSGVAWQASSFTTVKKIDVTPDGSKLVAVGNFNVVGGQTRTQIAILDLGANAATVNGWTTDRFRGVGTTPGTAWCSSSFDTYLHDVDFSSDGSFFVVGTTGAYRAGRLCDTVSRWETNPSTGNQVETWAAYTGGDTVWSVEVAGPTVFVGGHMRYFNNPYRGDGAGPGAVPRTGMAALDVRNGLPFSWNPGRQRGVGLFDFDVTASQVWAGSDTAKWAGESRPRLAGFPYDGDSTTLPADEVASLPADVVSLGTAANASSQSIRNFDGTSILGTGAPAGSTNWSLARGAVMIDGTVYYGWADSSSNGSLRARTFDGTNFGAERTLNLYNNGYTTSNTTYRLFSNDLPYITGMFYDRANARLYYTMKPQGNGQGSGGGFFYRHFTPESGIVGSTRFAAAGGSLIGANNSGSTTPQGMFLADGKVYYSDSAGELERIDFDAAAGGVTGTATTVNTSADWRTNAMFASTAPTSTGPNADPTAALSGSCQGLACTLDASGSSDTDGTIASYSFNFGDGASTPAGQSATAQHTYAAGTYTATVTVIDNRGGTDTETVQLSPAPITSPIQFRTSDKYTGSSKATHNWTIPGSVVAGDQMVLAVSGSTLKTLTTPAGWTVLDEALDKDLRTVVLGKVATASDAGSAVSLVWSGATRTTAVLAAYSGVADASATGAIEPTARTTHTTPTVNVPVDGSWVLSYWADKNTATTDWTAPPAQNVRQVAVDPALVGTTTTRVTGLFTDDVEPSGSGSRAGLTATANASSGKATMFTIVLTPTP